MNKIKIKFSAYLELELVAGWGASENASGTSGNRQNSLIIRNAEASKISGIDALSSLCRECISITELREMLNKHVTLPENDSRVNIAYDSTTTS